MFLDNLKIDVFNPIDISIPLSGDALNPIAWYQKSPRIEPVVMGDWIGKVSEGNSSTNFNNIFFNPHAHGTHTECLGHITKDFFNINECLTRFFFIAELITVNPLVIDGDKRITQFEIEDKLQNKNVEALIIRTLPNENLKKHINYSNSNPPYLEENAAIYLRELGIKHLLIDLPSVDKEKDGGQLLAHKAFWNVKDVENLNSDARLDTTITELIYVDDQVLDGVYVLNLQIVSFVNDASPSKPILYKVIT